MFRGSPSRTFCKACPSTLKFPTPYIRSGASMPISSRVRRKTIWADSTSFRTSEGDVVVFGVGGYYAAVLVEVMEGGGQFHGVVGQVVGFQRRAIWSTNSGRRIMVRIRFNSLGLVSSATSPWLQSMFRSRARLRMLWLRAWASDVVHRVFGRLLLGQFQVKLHLCGGRAGQEEVAAGVGAHLVGHFLQGYKVGKCAWRPEPFPSPASGLPSGKSAVRPLGSCPGLPRRPSCGARGPGGRRPNVDDVLELPLDELVVVVGDV